MSHHRSVIHSQLRALEGAFDAFVRGQRNKLFDSRDALVKVSQEVQAGGWAETVPLCDVTAKLLGRVLREGGLDERAALEVVRELLGVIEGQVAIDPSAKPGQFVTDSAGGVFKVVNESRLGEVLVKMGKLHPAQVQQALVLQRVSKDKRFGEVLIAMNAIDQRTLEEALSAQHTEAKSKGTGGMPSTGLRLAPLPDLPDGPLAPLPQARPPQSQPPPLPHAGPGPAPAAPLAPTVPLRRPSAPFSTAPGPSKGAGPGAPNGPSGPARPGGSNWLDDTA